MTATCWWRKGAMVLRGVVAFLVLSALTAPRAGLAIPSGGDEPGEAQPRPVIGLVLSGGGATGLAHIGVIRWLEEHRIPVDLVAGTSIGGLVGGLYATGADAAEMEELIAAIDWPLVLSTEAPYQQKSFRRKQDAREAPATFELGLRDGFSLPPGFDPGHQVGLVLDRIAFPYADVESFGQLPTPFACVAVDLESGEEVVFRDGRLAVALRATMSYPGWFAPVRSGEQVLVDGGVLNNLPTDVMQRMGADVIIAVDLGMVSSADESFDDVIGVLGRTLSVMMRDNTNRNAQLADTLIAPDVSRFAMTDFDRAGELTAIGYRAAAAVGAQLEHHALDAESWNSYRAARAERRRRFRATPEFIEVDGVVEDDRAVVRAALDHHLDTPLDPDHLDQDLTNITGWGRYDVVGYEGRRSDGQRGLGIRVSEKTYGPPFIRPILDLRGGEFGEALITFGARFTFFDVIGTNSEWRVDATYGQATQTLTELFIPLGHGGFFVAPRAFAGLTDQRVFEEGEAVAEFEIGTVGGGGDIGYLFGPRSEVRFGVDVAYDSAEVRVGEPLLDPLSGTVGAIRARWAFEGADSALVPTAGVRARTEARWVFTSPDFESGSLSTGNEPDDEFYQVELYLLGARHLGGRFSMIAAVEGGSSFDATASPLQQFLLGGPLRLGALGVGELRGSNYFLGRVGVLWALSDENRLSFFGKFWLAALYEVGDAFEREADPFHDVTFGLAGETLLGGIFVGGAVGQESRGGFFFAIGRIF